MGCGASLSEEAARSRAISRQLRKDYSREMQIVKLLLLGAGESGKSTIVKQMKLMHPVNDRTESGFSAEERLEGKRALLANIIDSMLALIEAVHDLGMEFRTQELNDMEFRIKRFAKNHSEPIDHLPQSVAKALAVLWQDSAIQLAYQRRNEFQLNDSAAYFLNEVHRFTSADFLPSDQDILHTRVVTTGIVRIAFEYRRLTFNMFDVGGQRSERKKWIHCFDNVTAVLFVVSLSEFDQVLVEDKGTNRMQESLLLFNSIVNNIHFSLKPFIVFFNKRDLFVEKLAKKSIRQAFPDYMGDNSVEDASEFLVDKYLNQSKTNINQRSIYPHITTATDTALVQRVFASVAEIILNDILKDMGLD